MRTWIVGLLAVALVLFSFLLTLVMPEHCPVNRAACARVKEGMTQAEVHAILGGPPGDYRTRPSGRRFPGAYAGAEPGGEEQWVGDEGTVIVRYSPTVYGHERVWDTIFQEADQCQTNTVELAQWRLKRLWKRCCQ